MKAAHFVMVTILFLSHITSPSIYRTFHRLKRLSPSAYDTIWLYDNSSGSPPWPVRGNEYRTYSADQLIGKGYALLGDALVPGNVHFPVIDFHREHAKYDYYWVIEYDVRFTGNWGYFFNTFADNESDLLTSNLSTYPHAKRWVYWDSLSHPSVSLSESERIRSFNPIYRISGKGLDFLYEAHKSGWSGHYEALMPTLLHKNGYAIEDFGGDGEFVPDDRVNSFYTSYGLNRMGADRGTHRYQPRFWRAGNRKNMIYHPVKPVSWFAKNKLQQLSRLGRFVNLPYVYGKVKERLSS